MMQGKDFRRLARLSLRAKKKTTTQTVLGISFGLVLLFPLLFLVIGFYGGFSAEINNQPSYRAMRVRYSNLKTISGQVFCDEKYEKEIDKISGVKNSIKYEYYYINNAYGKFASYSIDGGEQIYVMPPHVSSNTNYVKKRYLGIQVLDEECASKPFLDADYKYASTPLVAGKVFTKNKSKGEIMVSTKFLINAGLEAEDVIGSKLTFYNRITLTGSLISSSPDELIKPQQYVDKSVIPYFKDYTIVGVYDSNIYSVRSSRYYSRNFDMNSDYSPRLFSRDYFWITTASLGEKRVASAPQRISRQRQENDELINESWYYYEKTPLELAEKTTNDGYVFLPMGLGVFSRTNFYPTYTKTQLLEFSSFQAAKFGYDDIDTYYRRSVTGNPDNLTVYHYDERIAPEGFFVYQAFFDRFFFLCLGLAIFGGVIFIATLLNLVNSLHFSVESMKGFLGISRALGLKKRDVIRLFFNQIKIIFARSYIATIIIGGGICVGIKLLFDQAVQSQITEDSNILITLRWWYIPIALGVLLLLTTILSVVISHLLVRKINKTPILDILAEENRM